MIINAVINVFYMELASMKISGILASALIGVLTFMHVPCAWSIPNSITVSGYLEDEDGAPIEGEFPWEIRFYSTETTTTALSVIAWDSPTSPPALAKCVLGLFEIIIDPVPEVLMRLDEVWYSLAIDIGLDGLNADDLFEDRFRITSVPFALTGQVTDYFVTHEVSGFTHVTSLFECAYVEGMDRSELVDDMILCSFSTPAGGVKFDSMYVLLNHSSGPDITPSRVSFGIYDTKGTRIVSTGVIDVETGSERIAEIKVRGHLNPSTVYYAAWGTNHPEDMQTSGYYKPPIPTAAGRVPDIVDNGLIPDRFDPENIQFNLPPLNPAAPVIGLQLSDE